jgi:hypothetical protein
MKKERVQANASVYGGYHLPRSQPSSNRPVIVQRYVTGKTGRFPVQQTPMGVNREIFGDMRL